MAITEDIKAFVWPLQEEKGFPVGLRGPFLFIVIICRSDDVK
jgi:hypothetical protein